MTLGSGGGERLFSRLVVWLRGTVALRVRTAQPEVFLNRAIERGIPLRDAVVTGDGLVVLVWLRDAKRIRPAVWACHGHATFVRRLGAPFVLRRILRRPVLLLACAVAIFTLYLGSSHIWVIQVDGVGWIPPARIEAAAAKLGVRPGVPRSHVDAIAVSRRLPRLVPGLTWAGVTLRGVVATISVGESIRVAPEYAQAKMAGDIVATTAGLVTSITVASGQAQVTPGQQVKKGQVLIAGVALLPIGRTRQSGVTGGHTIAVHAGGTVLATKWIAAFSTAPLVADLGLPTGNVVVRHALLIGGLHVSLRLRGVPFGNYVLYRQVYRPIGWRTVYLPIEYTTLTYRKVHYVYRRLSWNEAADAAAAVARSYLLTHLPAKSRVLEERMQVTAVGSGAVGVQLMMEVEENIGTFRPIAVTSSG